MNIFKIGAGSGVKPGFVRIRVTIDEKGKMKQEIIRGGQSECSESAAKNLNNFLNKPVAGFTGPMIDVENSGHTDEYYEQKEREKPRSVPNKQEIKETDEDLPVKQPEMPTKREEFDAGYGI